MDRNILTVLALASLVGSPAALAQEAPAPEDEVGTAEEGEAAPIEAVPAPRKKGDKVRLGIEQAPGETHSVVRGDTLWDLSTRYLQTPWYWPKVWSYNPEIANPHWIYPGQVVRFFPSAEEGPSRVEIAEPEEPPAELPKELSDLSVGTMQSPDLMGQDEDLVTLAGRIGIGPVKAGIIRRDGFVTPAELAEAGRIESSFAELEMLSTLDHAYIRFRSAGAKVGDRYVIYRTVEKVVHPRTGQSYGYLTHILGSLRIARVDEKMVTGIIDRSFDEIRRGDYVSPFTAKFERPLERKSNSREMKGYVIASFVPRLMSLGEYHVVFVDRGKRDGLEDGQTFTVVRRSDGLAPILDTREESRVPQEDIGFLMVLDTKDTASACLVLRSLREIVVGDRVEMRLRGSRTAQAP